MFVLTSRNFIDSTEGSLQDFRLARIVARDRGAVGDKYIITVFKEDIVIDKNTPQEIKTYLDTNHNKMNLIKPTKRLDERLR